MLFPKQTVKNISESIGIAKLNDDVTNALSNDVEYRIHQIIEEALKFMRHSKRTKLHVEDINYALKVKNFEPLYGFGMEGEIKYHKATSGYEDLYYVDEEEVELDDIINQPLPDVPLETTYTAHWLAIEGVQPKIKQNPIDPTEGETPSEKKKKVGLDGEKSSVGVQVTPLVKHALSKELQLYYDCVTTSLGSDDPVVKSTALESLGADAGIHQLVPYFIQYIADKVTHNLHDLDSLQTAMSVAKSILSNPNIFVEPYLHQLMPALLTCLVGKKLCESPGEDHWSLREKAASMIAYICTEFGGLYHTLQARITRTLLRAFLDPSKPLTTHYGAITGLYQLGSDVIRVLLVPNVKAYMTLLETELSKKSNPQLVEEAGRCRKALLIGVSKLVDKKSQFQLQSEQSPADRPLSIERRKQLVKLLGLSFVNELSKNSNFNEIANIILQSDEKEN
ncbi:histone H4-like TAF Taf6, SAGA complex subunit [Mycoemilia scoparia]|uniref:TBP-associated factor 6 n=1 Tax=Mycoemilia scoparia TaxID=417184 RepID=A0A9W8A696_9FUNG|nr:histone H4-like TAF Taf6, SAGA complex subunit [Mycoemilia scoparia]